MSTEPSTIPEEGLVERVAKGIYAIRPFAMASTATSFGHQIAQTFEWDGAPAYYQEDMKELARAALAASGHTALLSQIGVRLPKLVMDAYEEGVEDGMDPERVGCPEWIDSVARVEMLRAVAALSRPLP